MTDDCTHGHHQITNIKTRLIMFFADKDGEAQYSQQKQDLELIVAHIMSSLLQKFRLKLNKVGKNTRSFRYDLNQIPYDYRVEVTSCFKGLNLTHRVPEEHWTEVHDIEKEAVIKIILKKKK